METLEEFDSRISRLHEMGAQEAFFHPDFVRLISLVKFPYLYDGKGTEVPKEMINKVLALIAEKAEGMPKDLAGDDYSRHLDTCAYIMNALSSVEIDEKNADLFVRIFLEVARGGTPPKPMEDAGGSTDETGMGRKQKSGSESAGRSFFDAACYRDAVFQKMLDFRSKELCKSIASRISELPELRESAIYLFAVALDHSSSGLELDIRSVMELAKFCKRWSGEAPPGQYGRTFEEGKSHLSEKVLEFEMAVSALLKQIKEAQRQRMARIYDMQEFRARWRENRSREAAIARNSPHLARKLRICTGRC